VSNINCRSVGCDLMYTHVSFVLGNLKAGLTNSIVGIQGPWRAKKDENGGALNSSIRA
jgi:hypothetical protein